MPRRALTIRGVTDPTLRRLRASAEANHRSLNGELLAILERANADKAVVPTSRVQPTPPVRGAAVAGQAKWSAEVNVDREALRRLCQRFHITRLAVFGSLVSGDARPDSDVDVLVEFEPGMTPGLGVVTIAEALRPAFGGRKVDLVTPRGLRPSVRDRIVASAVPLYGD